jgi:hypothetical protein
MLTTTLVNAKLNISTSIYLQRNTMMATNFFRVICRVNMKFDSENKMGSITSLVIEPGASNSTTSYFLMMSTTSNARYCSIVTIIRNTHANVQTVPYVYIKPSALFLNKYAYNYMEIYNIC